LCNWPIHQSGRATVVNPTTIIIVCCCFWSFTGSGGGRGGGGGGRGGQGGIRDPYLPEGDRDLLAGRPFVENANQSNINQNNAVDDDEESSDGLQTDLVDDELDLENHESDQGSRDDRDDHDDATGGSGGGGAGAADGGHHEDDGDHDQDKSPDDGSHEDGGRPEGGEAPADVEGGPGAVDESSRNDCDSSGHPPPTDSTESAEYTTSDESLVCTERGEMTVELCGPRDGDARELSEYGVPARARKCVALASRVRVSTSDHDHYVVVDEDQSADNVDRVPVRLEATPPTGWRTGDEPYESRLFTAAVVFWSRVIATWLTEAAERQQAAGLVRTRPRGAVSL